MGVRLVVGTTKNGCCGGSGRGCCGESSRGGPSRLHTSPSRCVSQPQPTQSSQPSQPSHLLRSSQSSQSSQPSQSFQLSQSSHLFLSPQSLQSSQPNSNHSCRSNHFSCASVALLTRRFGELLQKVVQGGCRKGVVQVDESLRNDLQTAGENRRILAQ